MRGNPVSFRDFAGGIDTDEYGVDQAFISDNHPRLAANVLSTSEATLQSRDGCATIATPGNGLVGFAPYPTGDAGTDSIVQEITTGKLYGVDVRTGATTLIGTLPSTGQWDWVIAPDSGGQGPMYGSDGQNVRYFDGASLGTWTASTGTLHAAPFIVYAGNRVWMAIGSDLYFSNLADPRDWPAANVVQFDPGGESGITGLASIGPYVIVAKADKLWAVYDLDTGANRQISNGVGCIGHRTMKATPQGLFFAAWQGIYSTDGNSVKPITKHSRIEGTGVCGAFWDNRYFLSYDTAGNLDPVNNYTLEYDQQLGTLWAHPVGFQQMATFAPADATEKLYGVTLTGKVTQLFKPGVTQDFGAAFTAHWRGPWWELGQPAVRKRVRGVTFDGRGTLTTVGVAKDYSASIVTVGSGLVLQSGPAVAPARLPGLGVARAWSLDLQSTSAFELRSIALAAATRAD